MKVAKEPAVTVLGMRKAGLSMCSENILQMLEDSKYTVAMSGSEMLLEDGYPGMRDGDESYDIEQKYGYSVEELLSSVFYATRKELFFEFYKTEFLAQTDILPGKGFLSLQRLEKYGLIQCMITKRRFGVLNRAGCRHVINLHGSIYDNTCPKCGGKYTVEYMKSARGVPLCTKCKVPIRPNICLYGEMVDNGIMTQAAEEIQKADVLLVLGTSLHAGLCHQLIQYYTGDKLILITNEEHFSDKLADVLVYSRSDDALEKLVNEYQMKLE